jgi:hypothetical protein
MRLPNQVAAVRSCPERRLSKFLPARRAGVLPSYCQSGQISCGNTNPPRCCDPNSEYCINGVCQPME